eukprot:scaffold132753_cov47-Prasinocladus_malaysianus.AAC.1
MRIKAKTCLLVLPHLTTQDNIFCICTTNHQNRTCLCIDWTCCSQGGHYFLERRFDGYEGHSSSLVMKDVHSVELEYWLYRQAMSAALLCYYDKKDLAIGATCDFAAAATALTSAGSTK